MWLGSHKFPDSLTCSIVRQLSMDVMSTIFEFCLLDFTDIQLSLAPYTEKAPYLLEPSAVLGETLLSQRLVFADGLCSNSKPT